MLTEAIYLLARYPRAQAALLKLLQNGALSIAFRIDEHVGVLHTLLKKYCEMPMSLADACVVRMAQIHERHPVLTLDSDFSIYRKNGRMPLTLIDPARPSRRRALIWLALRNLWKSQWRLPPAPDEAVRVASNSMPAGTR